MNHNYNLRQKRPVSYVYKDEDGGDAIESPPTSRQRRNEEGNEPVRATETNDAESITNINYDCLEHIFDYLDLVSLLNCAQTCKRLQIAAAAKFSNDHGKKPIRLYSTPYSWFVAEHHGRPGIYIDHLIHVVGRMFGLPFLCCFGAKLLNLNVFYDEADEDIQNDRLNRYINQFCADTLLEISMYGKLPFVIEHFPKPFKNVVKVGIFKFDLEKNLSNLVNLFPNLRHLEMDSVRIDKPAASVHFPNLQLVHSPNLRTLSIEDNSGAHQQSSHLYLI